jgi:hypothetical protein
MRKEGASMPAMGYAKEEKRCRGLLRPEIFNSEIHEEPPLYLPVCGEPENAVCAWQP